MSWTYSITTTNDWTFTVTEGTAAPSSTSAISTKSGTVIVTKDGKTITTKN